MSKKAKKIITTILSALLLVMTLAGNGLQVRAQGAYIIQPEPEVYVLVPGEKTTLKVTIRAVGASVDSPIIVADTAGTPFTVSQPKLKSIWDDISTNYISEFPYQYLEFDVTVDETAKIGIYPIKLKIYGTDRNTGAGVDTELTVNTQILVEREPAQLAIYNIKYDNAVIGKNMNLSFTIRNEGDITARSVYVSIDYADTGMTAGYSTKNIKVKDIERQKEVDVNLPIKILPKAKPGMNTLTVNLTHKTSDGNTVTEKYDIYVTLKENDNAPNLILDGFEYTQSVKPGEKLGLVVKIKNNGKSTAYNPKISVDDSSIGTSKFIKDYYTDYIELWDIDAKGSYKAEIPLLVSKEATGGLKDIKLNIVYYDEQGVEYQSSVTIYPNIEAEGVNEDGTPLVIISNVSQTPDSPEAGGRLTVSFDIENKSAKDLNDFKIEYRNLAGSSFAPVNSDPYKYIGVLKAGTKQRITLDLLVSENATEGLNILSLAYSYAGSTDIGIDIPILNVVNDLGSASKPKLIISNYETDAEELRAGSVFNFTFEVRNTHSSVAAKNIIITVSGKEPGGQSEIFSVTHGSNNFFVNKIGPGETYSNTLEMKVKSDAATLAYPITVDIEYEYDGIKPNPTTGKIGETVSHELLLQVVENARPVVNYVQVYSWDSNVTVGSPATIGFEFYNMGKSMLYNVAATVEGDFTNAGGDIFYMGNVNSGDRSYAEFEVIPNVEGLAKGTVRITFEDSNGNEQVYTKEFEAMVMGAQVWVPGYEDGGLDVFNPVLPEPKKAILPTWAFVLVQVAIFVIFVPVSRKVIINIYKNKLRKKEDEMF